MISDPITIQDSSGTAVHGKSGTEIPLLSRPTLRKPNRVTQAEPPYGGGAAPHTALP